MDYSLPGSSVHRLFQARILEWVAIFLLQGIFPTQGLNPCLLCLLHCRRILYLRSHQGSPSPCLLVAQSCLTLCNPMDCSPARLICPWNSLGKNTGVGCHSLPQGIFLSRESNPGLLHCRQILYNLSHQGSPSPCLLVAQSCLTLCNPMDCSLPGSPVQKIPQERILEWVAIPFPRGSS